jgi:zinc transport system substrate-binding protein
MKVFSILIAVLLIAGLLFSGCTNSAPKPSDDKVLVVATLFPLYEFAREVGGDKVNVVLLLPPGAEAHTFEPKPSDIIKINQADLFIFIGEEMEPWAHDILEGTNNKELIVLNASSKVTLLKSGEHTHEETHTHEDTNTLEETPIDEEEHEDTEDHHHGEFDPHIWLDFSNDEKIVNAIAEELSLIDSNNASFYKTNAENYNNKFKQLNSNYSAELSDCNHTEFITGGHAAFAYLANSYNLESISAFGISPDSEPTPQRIKTIIDLTKEHNIKYIFFERLVNPRMAETIASEANAKTLILNPAHNLTKEQFESNVSFIDLMNENLNNLKIGLECS